MIQLRNGKDILFMVIKLSIGMDFGSYGLNQNGRLFTHNEADPSMEEEKAAAYYEELTRKGEGAARFKQGLGYSASSSSSVSFPQKPSSSSSSLFSNFVRATSPGKAEKQAQLEAIQAKLRRSQRSSSPKFRSSELRYRSPGRDDRTRRRSSSMERRRERDRDCVSRSRDRRRRSRSYSEEEVEDREGYRWNKNERRDRDSSLRGNMISSSRDLKRDHKREDHWISAKKSDTLDYSHLIVGYSKMTPAERVKAKMKLQLSQTAAKDSTMGMSSGWERFDFNKDAPLDDDNDEIDVAEDDASLVKEIGNSFRFSAVQAKREEQIKAAHDEAMFGGPTMEPTILETSKDAEKANNGSQDNNLLISDKVLTMQQGSWRDRAGRFKTGVD